MTNNQTDPRPNGAAPSVPSTFKYLLVASALFIASVSAFFSVQGLGFLFAGSATAVMVMAASLEVGKLVAASFLSRYWSVTHGVLRIYLVLAVLSLIGITSLGNYGYLARAYERTHTQIGLFESQITSIEKEIADTQRQIDGARGSLAKVSAASREDIGKLQQRITTGNEALSQALARLQERRKTAQDRRDRDVQAPSMRMTEQAEVLKKALAAEEAEIAALNERMATLDKTPSPRFTVEEAAITSLNERLAALDRAPGPKFTIEEAAIVTLNERLAALDKAEGPKFVAEESAIATLNERLAVLDRAVDAYTKQGAGGLFKFDNIKKGQLLQEQQRPAREAIAAELAGQRARIEELRVEHLKQQARAREVITADITAQRAHIEELRTDFAKQQVKTRADISAELATLRTRIEQLRTEHARQQVKARETITAELAGHRASIELLRTGHAKQEQAADREVAAVREQFAQETARLDAEEKETRRGSVVEIAEVEKQLQALQSQGQATASSGETQSESLYQRIRTRNEDIHHLRGQIAAVDIGSYRFVARAFDATADGVVKWLMLALVLVFDPLAVSLVIGFNVALLGEPASSRSRPPGPAMEENTDSAVASVPRSRWQAWSLGLFLVIASAGAVGLAGLWGTSVFRDKVRASHSSLIPGESFAVLTFRPDDLSRSAQGKTFGDWLGEAGGKVVSDTVSELMTSGFDPAADLYVFAKFPAKEAIGQSDRPVMLCGFVARVTDPVAVEAALSRLADQVTRSLRTSASTTPSRARSRAMIRHANGRYMDPEGGFFTFGLTGQAVVLMVEFEGNPQAPCVEAEIRRCLAPSETASDSTGEAREQLPLRARSREGAVSLWFDSGRFCKLLPKNAAAQTRYQQLEKHVGFDLLLSVQPAMGDQLNLVADYAYQGERFKDRQQATPLQVLNALGSGEAAGVGGRLMERCLDTLDYDSLIERLRGALGGTNGASAEQVLVEKTFTTERDARFVLSARYESKAGPPLLAAMQTLFR
ncbi:MAG: hypothetical protein EBS05_11300 [Proteobacteria bacterium]|nr:hypothetical protein [Pseudomonadota bacterium]